jgi:hypothetical protein
MPRRILTLPCYLLATATTDPDPTRCVQPP